MSSHNAPVNLDLADRDWRLDELYIDWRAASATADAAYAAWKAWPDRDRYTAYVAAPTRRMRQPSTSPQHNSLTVPPMDGGPPPPLPWA